MAYTKKTNKEYTAMNKSPLKLTVEDVSKFPILAIDDRSITKKTCEHFGIRTELGEDGKTPIALYFPYTDKSVVVGYKRRDLTLSKKTKGHFSVIGYQGTSCDFFGTNVANKTGGKRLLIVEGELDAAICWQVLKEKYPSHNPSVVSISSGTGNAVQNIAQKHNMSFIKKFKQVVVAFDADRATPEERSKGIKKGLDATDEVYGLLPEMLVVSFPEDKDPCDMFKEDGKDQLYWALMKPTQYTPDGFILYKDIRDKAIALPVLGKPWPWPSLTKHTLGRRRGEGYYFGAGVKMGKSTLVDQFADYVIRNEKNVLGEPQKIALFKFEENPDETVKRTASKFYKRNFVDPEKVIFINDDGEEVDIYGEKINNKTAFYSHQELITAVDSVGPSLILYNNYGSCSWDNLKGAIRHAVLVEHVEDIVIDPISRLTSGMSASDTNQELERFADEISKMSNDLGFTYYCFSHLKAPEKGPPHEFGGKIYSQQFTGSRAMMRACHYMFGLWGNKDPELDDKKKNTRKLFGLEDRKYGRTCIIDLFYDTNTTNLIEPPPGFLESEYETISEFLENSSEEQQGDY